MTNRDYTAAVERGEYPEDPSVPFDEPFVNHNGSILNLVLEKFSSAAIIRSVVGAIRANHYHRTDWHYTYIISGHVEYYWRPVGSKEAPSVRDFRPGTMFFTPPMVEHAMHFLKDSEIITFAKNIRDHKGHEEDVVRVALFP